MAVTETPECLGEMLLSAAWMGNTEELKILLEKKDIDINFKDEEDITPLMFAIKKGHTEIAKILIEKGANLDIQNTDGETALMIAKNIGHPDIVEFIVNEKKKPARRAYITMTNIGLGTTPSASIASLLHPKGKIIVPKIKEISSGTASSGGRKKRRTRKQKHHNKKHKKSTRIKSRKSTRKQKRLMKKRKQTRRKRR